LKTIITYEFDENDCIGRPLRYHHAEDYYGVLFDFAQWLHNQIDERDKSEYQPVWDALLHMIRHAGVDEVLG